jgi:murein DD-endopeptidase MepM/ murein hydrolase activator NlpD
MRLARFPAGSIAIILLGTCAPLTAQPPAAAMSAAAAAPLAASRFGLPATFSQGGVVLGTAPRGTTLLMLDGAPVPMAPDGRFLIAFDRDATMGSELVATLENGSQIREPLTIAPRAWNISRLDSVAKVPMGQPAYDRLRPPEVAAINAARRMQTDAQGWRQPFLWPVTGRISTLFGSQRIYKGGEAGSYHSGIDIARPAGTVVLAPADGVVILATDHPFTLEGNMIMIDHGMQLNSALMHLSRIDVTVGQHVRRGQPIGRVGATGARVTGPHLHWGLKWREARVDPLLLAGPMPVAD